MKISCKQSLLLENIRKIEGAVSVKTSLPVLNNFLLETIGNKVQFVSTDLEMTVKCQISDIDIIDPGSITIPAKHFIGIVKELDDTDIKIEADDKNMVTVKCNKLTYKLNGLPKSEFPPIVEPKKDTEVKLKINQGMLKDMIKKTIFSVSTDETRKILTGIYFIIDKNEIKLVGTDGHRLAFYKNSIGNVKESVKIIIPVKILNELVKFMEDDKDVEISILENQITFSLENLTLISRLIEGQYPSYEQIINKVFDKKLKTNTDSLSKAVRRVSLLAIDKTSALKIKAVDNKLLVSAVAEDVGQAEEEVITEYKGEEITIAFNAKYVADVLRVIGSADVDIQLRDTTSAGLIKPVNDDKYLYIIMPVRI